MPIGSFIEQPAINKLMAAYRPIVLRVEATKTGGDPIPPVVFCDVYINNIYYRTISKTQYTKLNLTNTEWEFDIQDMVQEYLKKYLGVNGGSDILDAVPVISIIFCRFRSSGLNGEGFITPENTAPIQGTDDVDPVAGTGIQSNSFYGLNATLQHEDNQDLATHLDTFKFETWNATSYPLTHRPNPYLICKNDSDYFPIITSKEIGRLTLNYQKKSDLGNWYSSNFELTCTPGAFVGTPELPDGVVGEPYEYVVELTGTAPFTLQNIIKPSWMTIAIVGSTVVLSGTPDVPNTEIDVSFQVFNCCDENHVDLAQQIDVIECVAGAFVGIPEIPDGEVGVAYLYEIELTGTQPFTLSGVVKPSWMTIVVVGDTISLSGTPDVAGENLPVQFVVNNCHDESPNIDQIIDITEDLPGMEGLVEVLPTVGDGRILNVTFESVQIPVTSGAYPITSGQGVGVTPSSEATGMLIVDCDGTAGSIRVSDSNGTIQCQNYSGAGSYNFPGFVIHFGGAISVQMDSGTC